MFRGKRKRCLGKSQTRAKRKERKKFKMVKIIGVGHLILSGKKTRLEFHSDGKVFMGDSNGTKTLEYKGEPLLVESLIIFNYDLFDLLFSEWDD